MHGAKSFLSAFLTTWVAEHLCLVKNFFKAASVLRLNSLATWLKLSASTHFPLLASFLYFRNILFAKGLLAPLPPASELWPVNRRRPVRGGSGCRSHLKSRNLVRVCYPLHATPKLKALYGLRLATHAMSKLEVSRRLKPVSCEDSTIRDINFPSIWNQPFVIGLNNKMFVVYPMKIQAIPYIDIRWLFCQ